MIKFIVVILIILSLHTGAEATSAGSAYVPLDEDIYRIINLLVMEGIVPLNNVTHRPLTREDIANALMMAVKQDTALQGEKYSNVLINDLKYYLRDYLWDIERIEPGFTNELTRPGHWFNSPMQSHWHVGALRNEEFSVIFDPIFWFRYDNGNKKDIIRRAAGVQLHGHFQGWLGYYFRFRDHVERGNGPYKTRDQLLYDNFGYVGPLDRKSETYYDLAEAYLTTRWKTINVTFGKDKFAWGPPIGNSLLLSGNAPSFNHFRVNAKLTDKLSFNYIVGKLMVSEDVARDTVYQTGDGWTRISLDPKWLVAHRVEYAPFSWATLGVAEALIWGERGLDMAYLNPVNFFYSAQHEGDLDNVLMSADLTIRLPNVGLAYMELLLDDFTLFSVGTSDPSNKIGIRTGLWLYNMGIQNLETGIEYTLLRPYVYSHFFPINRFSTWTSSLGSDVKPNSDRFVVNLYYKFLKNLSTSVAVTKNRHGSLGGDITIPEPRLEAGVELTESAPFLGGVRTEWTSVEWNVSWEPTPGVSLESGLITNEKTSLEPDRIYVGFGYRYSLSK